MALPKPAGKAAGGPPAGRRLIMHSAAFSRMVNERTPTLPITKSSDVLVPGTVNRILIRSSLGMPLNLPPALPHAPWVKEQYSAAQFSTVILWQQRLERLPQLSLNSQHRV